MPCDDRVQQQWQLWRTRNSEPLTFFLDGARSPERIIFLGASLNGPAEKLKCASLFIVARDDANTDGPRLPRIRAKYEKTPEPKELLILDGSAHAQFLLETNQAERMMREILRF